MEHAGLLDRAVQEPATLARAYAEIRRVTERLCAALAPDDYMLQTMDDVSPAKWHLAHVSWFFETFVLEPHAPGHTPHDPAYRYLFNSYYNDVGPQFDRPRRGQLSRPTTAEVYAYRAHVDDAMARLFAGARPEAFERFASIVVLGLNHEQQHQELLLTDIKYNLSGNPLRPAYHDVPVPRGSATEPLEWVEFPGGVQEIGHDGAGFAFDNETPRHRVYLEPWRLASRLITNGEYLEFMRDGGYRTPTWWLSEGWKVAQERRWTAPLYWEERDRAWYVYTLSGLQLLDVHAPVAHVSYFEADAFARWCGRRLPAEAEWERAAESSSGPRSVLMENGVYQPQADIAEAVPEDGDGDGVTGMIGNVWEWTRSPYAPYPGFWPPAGALGEYNGKFMVNQMVLRGGSCATPASHIRVTYRNFFAPDARWQFSGIRLADDG